MSRLSKVFMGISVALLLAAFLPGQGLMAAIFGGTTTEDGVPFGFCLNNPQNMICVSIDCNEAKFLSHPLCVTETEAGTNFAKESLTGTGITHTDNVGDYIKKLVNFSLPYLTLAAFLGYVVAGFLYVTSFGNDDQLGKAKKILIWASLGLILVILSYAITNLFTGDLVKELAG